MTDTTTIEITTDQRDTLEARKQHERESFKAVVGRLLDGENNASGLTEFDEGFIEATLAESELSDQLDRIESAAKEATNAAQNAERAAEELGGQR